jgi:hypothetical protein
VIAGGDSIELFACVDKGGGRTEMAHVFEHNAVVGGIESAFEIRVHDVHSSTKFRTRFRTFASRLCNHASILLTNILKS